jgi:hypothetical protein
MLWYDKIIAAHRKVTDSVSHYERLKSKRYFVWQEDGRNDDIGHVEKAICGTTDLFTNIEFDPWCAELEAAFTEAGITWRLNSVQYETDVGIIHYEWQWEVLYGSDAV